LLFGKPVDAISCPALSVGYNNGRSLPGEKAMRLSPTLALVPALFALPATPVFATDDPATLVQRDCMSCHGNEVYTRENRMVNSLDSLRHQISRCHQVTGKAWSADQSEAVVQYLNSQFYKF
jgi:mono/diheme cytochrome c family protein